MTALYRSNLLYRLYKSGKGKFMEHDVRYSKGG